MKAIRTQILPATNSKPTRMRADAEGVRRVITTLSEIDSSLERAGLPINEENQHRLIATRLCVQHDWPSKLASGGLPDGSWAHCFIR